jgi:hypothetical protein
MWHSIPVIRSEGQAQLREQSMKLGVVWKFLNRFRG